ncbi:DUF4153 domain-containing protein [Roseovarius spongiae]|uniref:DUF4153 domain-containing protein n=1 Tax=Roseovarius spongiae TaxID=2320272 RepID=A0A3A8B2H4_9RHOB|nr:DUF4153 domain-containing protein [Roseovarius spongiae]RKF13805.1 DUF4153 domain-containing protein [Roseovarius spongiae]
MNERGDAMGLRGSLALIGAIAGLALWALFEVIPEVVANARLALFLVAGGVAFFGVLLALAGPVRLMQAAAASALLSLCATLLLLWASLRFDATERFLEIPHHVLAFACILMIATPFIAAGLIERGGWRRYALLFDTAWEIVVRYAAAVLFVGVVWGVVTLSDALLQLVGIGAIDWLLSVDVVPYLLSGLAFGVGLAIVLELDDYVSPFLIIQLLRVLIPVVFVVLAIFILALPVRGLSGLFGGLSAAATLAAVSLAAITLVTTGVHREDARAVEGWLMLGATKALTLLVSVPAVLSVYAVWLRIAQYGLTPDRVAALVGALIVAVYALAYAASIPLRDDWTGRVRAMNRWMALATIAVAALWLTPALNAERLSAASQVARAEAGAPLRQLALYEMAQDWGRAGKRGLERVLALAEREDSDAVREAVAAARRAETRWDYDHRKAKGDFAPLDQVVPVLPAGTTLPPGAFGRLRMNDRGLIHEACQRRVPGGYPACVLFVADFDPLRANRQAIGFFEVAPDRMRVMAFELRDGVLAARGSVTAAGEGGLPKVAPSTITDLREGRFAITPYTRNALEVGGLRLVPQD